MRSSSAAQRVVRLNPADLPAMQRLFAEESAGVPAGFLQARGEPELQGYLDSGLGQAFGVFEGRSLLACSLLRLPRPEEFAGQPPFPFVPAGDWPQRTAFLETTLVRRWARGHGLQRSLVRARLAAAEAAGRRWLCCGVHRENGASWRNLLRGGLLLVGCRAQPQPTRFAFLKPLNGASLPLRPGTAQRAPCGDLDALQAALASGLVGAGLEPDGTVVFRAPAGDAAAAAPARAA